MNLYHETRKILTDNMEEGEASAIALLLLDKVAGLDRVHALMGDDSPRREELMLMAHRIADGEPVQYVLGEADFCGLTFHVAPGVLIPRPETEELVEWVADTHSLPKEEHGLSSEERGLLNEEHTLPNGLRLLDIGTGSGCIAISLAKKLPAAEVEAWDVSDDALRIAGENAVDNGVEVKLKKVDVLTFDVAADMRQSFDVIVSNPPYICRKEAASMLPNVLSHEPHLALFVPDDDPLLFYRRIAQLALQMLRPQGQLFFEINRLYGQPAIDMLRSLGYSDIQLRKDQFGNDRMIHACLTQ